MSPPFHDHDAHAALTGRHRSDGVAGGLPTGSPIGTRGAGHSASWLARLPAPAADDRRADESDQAGDEEPKHDRC